MTKRSQEVFESIQRHIAEHGVAPTFREIGLGVGMTKASVSEHVSRLERDGRIVRRKGKKQSIEVVEYESPGAIRLRAELETERVAANVRQKSLKAELEAERAAAKAREKALVAAYEKRLLAESNKRDAEKWIERSTYYFLCRIADAFLPGGVAFLKSWFDPKRPMRERRGIMGRPRTLRKYYGQNEIIGGEPCTTVFKRLSSANLIATTTYRADKMGNKHEVPIIAVQWVHR